MSLIDHGPCARGALQRLHPEMCRSTVTSLSTKQREKKGVHFIRMGQYISHKDTISTVCELEDITQNSYCYNKLPQALAEEEQEQLEQMFQC